MNNLKFATFRLGKTSIQDIKALDQKKPGVVEDSYSFVVTCTQVPDDLGVGTIVFVWLGSDNSKGMPTAWKQGFRGVGIVTAVDKATKYNDESHTTIELKYVFEQSVNRLDILRESPAAYYWCSALPIVGLDDHSNQTVRILSEVGDRSKIGAFLHALNSVQKTFRKDIVSIFPSMRDIFWDDVADPKFGNVTGVNGVLVSGARIPQVVTYGAPGTGKSHETKMEIAGKTWFRTTFHPDSDYASFVGTYKPTMREDGVALTEVSQKDAAGQLVGTEIHDQRKGIAYGFVDQVFTKAYVEAWRRQKKAAAGTTPEPVYLVIEEINRGNCAQVFGDIFQLLDRKSVGFSEYSIEPDADLGRFIGKEIVKETATIDAARKAQINALYPEATFDVVDEVLSGNRLLLPDNFFIRATMNTSDQSLFPMDSAFKRRWDWKYVPIKDAGKGWKIKFGDCERDWWKFLVAINKVVKGVTNSADKQLGYFFVKAKDLVIDAEMFVNKVAFYLWNDVFKDCELDGDAFKITREGGEVDVLAFQDFFKEDGAINEEVLKDFLTKLVPQPGPENDAAPQAGAGA